MSLDDQIENSDIFDELGVSDRHSVEEAKLILESIPLLLNMDSDNTERQWFDRNIKCQNQLINLRTRLLYLSRKFSLDIQKIKAGEIESGQYEFVRSKDERECLMLNNSDEYLDKTVSFDKIECLTSHVESLIVSLKAAMRLFGK